MTDHTLLVSGTAYGATSACNLRGMQVTSIGHREAYNDNVITVPGTSPPDTLLLWYCEPALPPFPEGILLWYALDGVAFVAPRNGVPVP